MVVVGKSMASRNSRVGMDGVSDGEVDDLGDSVGFIVGSNDVGLLGRVLFVEGELDVGGRVDGDNEVTTGDGGCLCAAGRDGWTGVCLRALANSVGISVFTSSVLVAGLEACTGDRALMLTLSTGVGEFGADVGLLLESAGAEVPVGKTENWEFDVTWCGANGVPPV
jgi:hypothetical protein